MNYQNGTFTPSYLPIGEIPFARDETWAEIADPEKLVVSTLGFLVTTERWQVEAQNMNSSLDIIERLSD